MSNKKLWIKGVVENGNLIIYKKDLIQNLLDNFEGKDVEILIEPYHKKRSNAQNRWYWGVAIPAIIKQIKEQQGEEYTKEDIHAYHLDKIIRSKFTTKDVLGKTVMIFDDVSTSKMNTKEFSIFKDKIQDYWLQNEINVPDPHDENFANNEYWNGIF